MTPAPAITLSGSAQIAGAPLFAPLTLTVEAGAWTCLLGPSGVGKTTILRLMAGLDAAVDFDGTIATSDNRPLAPAVAYMAQEDLLLPWARVDQNIALGARLRGEAINHFEVSELLAKVGLEGLGTRKPHELSGGQRQRVALARTLMEDKPIVLLDEPFSALDARTRADMQELAFELLADRTVLLVTHDPAEAARLGNKILVMAENGLTEIAPPPTPAPRDVDDPETLTAQGRLMTLLRARAA